jgi:beta-aspartyl-peptidase (threonine type)
VDEHSWAIIVHGGAKTISPDEADANRAGCRAAAEAGAQILRNGGSSIEATLAAIRTLEDDPTFNSGTGAVANSAGEIELDAAIMDGATLDVGAVAALKHIPNPISVAHAMLRAKPVLLVADGAKQFATEKGFKLDPVPTVEQSANDAFCDTVGCVALDVAGNFAAATSTGGIEGTHPGRVGDSSMPGCGLYAENSIGGVSLSGDGEEIARAMLAARVMQVLESENAGEAAAAILPYIERVGGKAGAIVIDRTGRFGFAHNSDNFAIGLATSRISPCGGIHRTELKEVLNHE